MPARVFRTEIAGGYRVGLEFDSEAEFQAFLGAKGMVLVLAPASLIPAPPVQDAAEPAAAPPAARRGRRSRDEEIAAAIDALGDTLEDCASVAAQARAVRTFLEEQRQPDDEPAPGLSTIETFIAVYRRPRAARALKIARE